jgi:hypothetical protein
LARIAGMVSMRMNCLVAAGAAMFALAGCATPKSLIYPYGVFDAPAKIETVKLPKDKLNPQMSPHITCTRYAGFMVKEVDLGEKGAEKLAILPADARCTVDGPGEILISDRIEGYFKGVIGDYVFFDASDGWDGGVPFYVFDPKGKKLFEDSVASGEFALAEQKDNVLRMHFDRVYHAPCSLYERTAECDNKIIEATGLGGEGANPSTDIPDCKAVYDAELAKSAPQYKEFLKASASVIRYPVELEYDGARLTIMPSGWGPASCSVPS